MNIRTGRGGVLASPIVKAVLDSLGVSYVIEQGQDESGNWYRRFSNGWVEQGGLVLQNTKQVNFPIAFSNTNFNLLMVTNRGSGTTGLGVTSRSTTNVSLIFWSGSIAINPENPYSWEAKGFAA